MTPERAKFHLCLLSCGERALLDAEIGAALTSDAPLSDLLLDLSVCATAEELGHTLHEYLLDHPADMSAVEALLRQELTGRFRRGEVTQEECLTLMRRAGRGTELAEDVSIAEEYADMASEGCISEEAAALCVDAILRGEPRPDVWRLDREIRAARRRGEPYPGENHPAIPAIIRQFPPSPLTIRPKWLQWGSTHFT